MITTSPGATWAATPIRLHIVPVGRNSAAS